LWRVFPATPWNRLGLIAAMIVLGVINPKWIWDATIAGDGELAFGDNAVVSVGLPWQTLTVISYQLYALLGLFLFAILGRAADWGDEPVSGEAPDEMG